VQQSIFITGVSSGIGQALAAEYLHQGHFVYGLSRLTPAALIGQSGFHFCAIDLSQPEQIRLGLTQLFSSCREVHLAILNAGKLGKLSDLAEVSLDELQSTMMVNVWANKVVLDTLFAGKIAIHQVIAMSSGAATHPTRGFAGYAISKAALNMLIGLYAAERTETHFSTLAPGIVDTAMQVSVASVPDDPRFPALSILKAARGTSRMPPPEKVAGKLIAAFANARQRPSGSFLDVADLV
jgi:benzil reductase ((S)-benzoin forming)